MKTIKYGVAALLLIVMATACQSHYNGSTNTTDTIAAPSATMPDSSGSNATVGGSGTGAGMNDTMMTSDTLIKNK